MKVGRTDLKLNDKYDAPNNQNNVCPLAHARDSKFKKNPIFLLDQIADRGSKDSALSSPGTCLFSNHWETVVVGDPAYDLIIALVEK